MQRRATKNTRAANAAEKRFLRWVKEQPCCICDNPGPSIADHCEGSTFRHNKILVGMWYLLPYCYHCDQVKTQGSRRAHFNAFGVTQSTLWLDLVLRYPGEVPPEVIQAVASWGR